MKPMDVENISIVKNGKRYKRTVIPDGCERCKEDEAEMVTWGCRNIWFAPGVTFRIADEIRQQRPIYIRRKM